MPKFAPISKTLQISSPDPQSELHRSDWRLGLGIFCLRAAIFAYRSVDKALRLCEQLFRLGRRRPFGELDSLMGAASEEAEPDATIGPILSRSDAPRLFELFGQLARRMHGAYPSEARVSYLPACGVLDLSSANGYPRQVLVIGLPCFEIWTIDEMQAVLAHELAHLKQEDALFTREILQFSYSLRDAAHQERLRGRWLNPRVGLAGLVARPLVRVAAPISRVMEYRADRWSADCFGSRPLASALEKLAVVQPVFREIIGFFDPAERPDENVYHFFNQIWRQLPRAEYRKLRRRLVDEAVAEPNDPHPPVSDRIRRLREAATSHGSPKESRSGNGASAVELLEDAAALRRVLHNRLYSVQPEPASVFARSRG